MEKMTIARPFKGITLKTGRRIMRSDPAYMEVDFADVREEKGVWDNFGIGNSVEKLNVYDFDAFVGMVSRHETIKKMSAVVRAEKDKDRRTFLKATRLPSVFFGEFAPKQVDNGTWKILKKGCLIRHSQILCIDIDNIDSGSMWSIGNLIDNNPYTLMRFTSASGNGYKLLMMSDDGINEETHELYYTAALKYWNEILPMEVKVDAGCKDLARRCYLSHDPKPYVNKECSVWTDKSEPKPAWVPPAAHAKLKSTGANYIESLLKPDYNDMVESAADRVRTGRRGNKEKGTDYYVNETWDFVDGQRHDFLVRLAAICKGWQMSEGDFRVAASHYISGTSDGDQTVRTQYARTN